MIERAELPVQRNSTLNGRSMARSRGCATGRAGRLRRGLRSATGLVAGNARHPLAAAVAIVGAFAGGEKGFPGDAGRIVDPGFLRPGVAAIGLALLDDVAAGLVLPRIDLVQLVLVLGLDAEMVETGGAAARRDGEIDLRIV